MKNTGAPMGDLDGWMQPFVRFSWRKSSSSFCSAGDRGNVQEQGSSVPGERSMAWSHAFCGGSSSKASLEKMSLKLWYWAGVGRVIICIWNPPTQPSSEGWRVPSRFPQNTTFFYPIELEKIY